MKQATKANVAVQNPDHYAGSEFAEPIDNIFGVGFGLGNAYKYIARLGLKGGDNTPTRDAKAAMWYITDTLVHLLSEDEGAYIPTLEMHSAFNASNYIKDVFAKIDERQKDRLRCADAGIKNIALSMIALVLEKERSMRFAGISERDYMDHVLDILIASYVNMIYANSIIASEVELEQFSVGKKPKRSPMYVFQKSNFEEWPVNMRELYKGTKENPLDANDPIYDIIEQQFALFDKHNITRSVGNANWLTNAEYEAEIAAADSDNEDDF